MESRNSMTEFITSGCAIVGGVASMSGLVQAGVQFLISRATGGGGGGGAKTGLA